MNLALILLIVISSQSSTGQVCTPVYDRLPVNSDIAVTCGPRDIQLSINVCPVYFANFNPNELALNGKHNQTACFGVMDNSTDFPIVKFSLRLDDSISNSCGHFIDVLNAAGSGEFSAYSTVQTVAISGYVDSLPIAEMGLVSYSTNLYYNFSCNYPLQYILKNTEMLTSFGAVAVNSNNGSFISTLRMQIFMDKTFSNESTSNGTIYNLLQTIYVQVSMNSSATSYNIYLDHCFATPSPFVTTTSNDSYSFFTGCSIQNKTTIISNGIDKAAKFSFTAFRFMQHSMQKTSSIYLHCIARLCESGSCPVSYHQLEQIYGKCSSSRKKRNAVPDATEPVTVSSGPIYVTDQASDVFEAFSLSGDDTGTSQLAESNTGIIVGVIVAAIIGLFLLFVSLMLYKLYRRRR
ncbi:zona pellucida-like domain-containing protein 1 [Mixophyes fleayi]|uniref:zona pellucida-like domain-containing protein 1 n=1 Tax=Mixophyes fleayi TaxID=3061075 RepID=UPI003F4E1110